MNERHYEALTHSNVGVHGGLEEEHARHHGHGALRQLLGLADALALAATTAAARELYLVQFGVKSVKDHSVPPISQGENSEGCKHKMSNSNCEPTRVLFGSL